MLNKRKEERKQISLPILIILFFLYLVGVLWGTALAFETNVLIDLPVEHRGIAYSLLQYILTYGLLMLLSRLKWGLLVIPLIVITRAFVHSVAVSTIAGSGAYTLKDVLVLCVPTVFYLTGVFGLSAVCVSSSLCSVRKISLRSEHIRTFRRGLMVAVVYSIIGACAELILHTI